MKNIKKMISKILILTVIISSFSGFEINEVFALGSVLDNTDMDQKKILFTLPSGKEVPLVVEGEVNEEINKKLGTLYMYEAMDEGSITTYNLGEPFGSRPFVKGQYQYLEGLSNFRDGEYDKDYLERLRTPEGGNSAKLIPQNDQDEIGDSYETESGYTYPEKGNNSFKATIAGFMKKIESQIGNEDKALYFNEQATDLPNTPYDDRYGNFRNTLTEFATRVGAIFFSADYVSGGVWDITTRNPVSTPHNDSTLINQGKENINFLNWVNHYADISKMEKMKNWDDEPIKIYNLVVNAYEKAKLAGDWDGIYYTFNLAVVMEDVPKMDIKLAQQAFDNYGRTYADVSNRDEISKRQSSKFVDAYQSESKNDFNYATLNTDGSWSEDINATSWDEKEFMELIMLFKYNEVHELGGHGYGIIQGVHKTSNGGLWYYSFSLGREISYSDIIAGQTPDGEWIGNNEEVRMRVREYDPVTGEYGSIIYQDVDVLQRGKTYIAEWFQGFRQIEGKNRTDTRSYHTDIKSSVIIRLNNNQHDILVTENKVLGYKVTSPDGKKLEIDYDQRYKDERVPSYTAKKGGNDLDDINGLMGYKQVFTIPDEDAMGNAVTEINLYASVADEDNYYKGHDLDTNDNADTAHDIQWGIYQVAEGQPEDFYVAHYYNQATPSAIPDLGLNEVVITEVNGEPFTNQELKPTDRVTLEIFVQRGKNSDSSVLFNNLRMHTEEVPDPVTLDLAYQANADNLYTITYNENGKFNENVPEIVAYQEFDSLSNTYSNWINYNKSTDASKQVGEGYVIKFELKDYEIPTMTQIQSDPSKWNLNVPQLFGKSSMEKLSLQFELTVDVPEADTKTDNNWARKVLTVGKPNQRNMYITEVAVYDEDGSLVQTFTNQGNPTTGFFLSEALDPSKNYYVVPKVAFEYDYGTQESNGSNLRLHSVVTKNNVPPMDMADTRYRIYSDISGRMSNGDIATYDVRSVEGIDVKYYDPNTEFNGAIIPLKHDGDFSEFSVWIKIPDENKTAGDNEISDAWDEVTISGTTNSASIKDNAVEDIKLIDSLGREFAEVGDDNYQLLDNGLTYQAFITVRRKSGNDDSMIDLNPTLTVRYRLKNTVEYFEETLQPYTGTRLKNVGDEIVYRLPNLYSLTDFISIEAEIDVADSNPSNNSRIEQWANIYNFHVRDLVVTPDKVGMAKDEYNKTVTSSIRFYAGFDTNGATSILNNVPIIVEEWEKTQTGSYTYVRNVYQRYHDLIAGKELSISADSIDVNYGKQMGKKFIVKINGGENGTQTYNLEKIRNDNETYVYTSSFTKDTALMDCSNLRPSNTWSELFTRDWTTGSIQVTKTGSRKVVDGDGNVEWINYEYKICDHANRVKHHEETMATFTETLDVKAFYKATGMNSYVDISEDSTQAYLRAGEKFDMYIQVVYDTNRLRNAPYRGTSATTCNSNMVSPNSPSYSFYPSLVIEMNLGSQTQVLDLHPTRISGTTATYHIFDTKHIPADTKNMDLKFFAQTSEVDGYIYDSNHPDIPLKVCESWTVSIEGKSPIDVGSQVIE